MVETAVERPDSQIGMPAAKARTRKPSTPTAMAFDHGAPFAASLLVGPDSPMPNALTKVANAIATVSARPAPASAATRRLARLQRWNPWKKV